GGLRFGPQLGYVFARSGSQPHPFDQKGGHDPPEGIAVPSTMLHYKARVAGLVMACAALGCGGGAGLTEPPTGGLEIATGPTGESPDPDGYFVSIDGGTAEAIAVAGTLAKSDVTQGNHTVELSGVDGNCVVEGQNPRTVVVIASQTVKDTFAVACTATQGSLA